MSLSKIQEQKIVERFNNGERNKTALAADYGVSPRTIGRVLERAGKSAKGFKVDLKKNNPLEVGDIVTGTAASHVHYVITTDEASMVVEKVLGEEIVYVKVLAHSTKPKSAGETYTVHSKYFVKVGHKTSEEVEEVEETLRVGDRVELVDIKEFCQSESNKVGNEGFIVQIQEYSSVPYIVEWDNGSKNSYYKSCLKLKTKVEEKATYIVSDMAITLMFDGHMQLIDSTHPYFEEVKVAIEAGQFSKAEKLMDIKKAIETFSEGSLKIQGGKVLFRGVEVRNELTSKIVALMSQGNEGFKGFAKFMAKVMDNPSSSTRERLMQFAAAEDIGITTEGLLICYKNVKDDYRPSRAGAWERVDGEWVYDTTKYYNNHVGQSPEMPRSEVDDRDEQTCSKGLHVMSLHYAKACWGTAGHTMVVHVDPVDFVSIPTDYNNSKARVCKYTVVSELTQKELDALLAKV